MSALTTLAAAPDAIAPWYASVLALLSFVVLMLLAFSASPKPAQGDVPADAPAAQDDARGALGETPVDPSADHS